MDNFRKFTTSRNHRNSVDGFTRGTSRHHTPNRHHQPAQSQPAQAQPPAKAYLDNFQAPNGFHAARQPTIQSFSHTLNRQPQHNTSGALALDMPVSSAPTKRTRSKKKRSLKRKILRSFIILGVTLVLIGGFLFGKGFLKARNIFKGGGGAAALEANVDPAKLNGEGDGRVNILMLGKGGTGHEAPDLTDTLIIASVDPIQNEATLLSIPRDLYVKSAYGTSKINAIYANAKYSVLAGKRTADLQKKAEAAGLEAIEKTLENAMGIPIHYYVMVDFTAFEQAINAVGGVDINVTTPVYELMRIKGKNYLLDVKTGQQHFDGFRGLAYARSRYTSPRGDFDRAERQRAIIVGLKEKILSVGTFGNPAKINSLISAFGDHMQSNLTINELLRLYDLGKNIPADKIASLSLVDPPNVLVGTGNIDGQSVVIPKAGFNNYTAIQSFVRNALKDAFLKKEDATIAVFNGTNTNGLAASKAEELESFGYNISTVGNTATRNYQKTVLVDLRNGQKKYTKHYLEQRLNTTAVTTMPDTTVNPGNADFVIILGTDASL